MKRIFIVALSGLLLLSAGYKADAQVNLNALKNAAKNKAASAIQNATRNASQKSQPANNAATVSNSSNQRSAVTNTVTEETPVTNTQTSMPAPAPVQKQELNLFPVHNVECPWPMAKDDYDRNNGPVVEYIRNLGTLMLDQVRPLKDALNARAKEDTLELERLKPLRLKMNMEHDLAFYELENELKRLEYFYSMLGDETTRFAYSGTVNIQTGEANINYIQVPINQTTVYVKWENNKEYFYSISGDKCFLEDEDIELVTNQIRRFYYVWFFLADQESRDYQTVALKAYACYDGIKLARDHNSVENIEFQPYPKGGPLNSLAAKALASAKQSSSYSDAIAVVIDAPSWAVDYDAFGQPVRRKAGGWVIKNTKYGKKAYRAQFSEDYMGGGKYGEIKLYGIGGGQHFVK